MARIRNEGEVLTLQNLVTAIREVGSANPAVLGDSYHLRHPIFGGDCDIEQFIKEFEEVFTIAEWPTPVVFYSYGLV